MLRVAALAFCLAALPALAQPVLEGPITGPGPVWSGLRPALTPGSEPEDFGYVSEEYFVSGSAAGQPYKTRIMLRRPLLAERSSGIVVAESMHSNGFAVTFQPAMKSILLRGHMHVEIAAQQGNVNNTLKGFNPERYASLDSAVVLSSRSAERAADGRNLQSPNQHECQPRCVMAGDAHAAKRLALPTLVTAITPEGGIVLAQGDNKDFDNQTQHCVGAVAIIRGVSKGSGYCRNVDAATGDLVLVEWEANGKPGTGTFRYVYGTGKWKGITGRGEYQPAAATRPVAAGTYQNCIRTKATYTVPKM